MQQDIAVLLKMIGLTFTGLEVSVTEGWACVCTSFKLCGNVYAKTDFASEVTSKSKVSDPPSTGGTAVFFTGTVLRPVGVVRLFMLLIGLDFSISWQVQHPIHWTNFHTS